MTTTIERRENGTAPPVGSAPPAAAAPVRERPATRAAASTAAGRGDELAIEATGLVRTFGETRAVDGVDLAIRAGEIYGFLGPNGAGKSTTVRILCTLLRPTEGRATVAGHDIAGEAEAVRFRIGAALQTTALDEKQTGREMLRLQGRLYGLTSTEVDARVEELLPLIDIGDAIDRRTTTYSGGMKRRLDLAIALIHNPTVLFLDEPTTGLDPVSRLALWEEIRRLNREMGMTIFLTTQYLEEADALADRVGIINEGKLAAEGTPEELKRAIGADVILIEFGGDPDAAMRAVSAVEGIQDSRVEERTLRIETAQGSALVSPVAVALAGAGVDVQQLTVRTPTLDDVFLRVTGSRLEVEG